MPDIYTHPNGYTVQRNSDGGVSLLRDDWYTHSAPGEVEALRDFLLDELGLWCDEETGALVVTGSWDGQTAAVIYKGESLSGMYPYWDAGLEDDAVARWRATVTPPPREPQPGEVWRLTLEDGTEYNALVGVLATGGLVWRADGGWFVPIDAYPPDRRRLLVEADGTVVGGGDE